MTTQNFPCDASDDCLFSGINEEELATHKRREHRPKYRLPELTFPLDLPGGYVDDKGKLHKQVTLAPFTGYEEDILSNEQLAKNGEHLRQVLANCITRIGDMEFPYDGRTPAQKAAATRVVDSMLWADKTFLTIMLRRVSARDGNIYRFKTECEADGCKFGPSDGRPAERIDLRELDIFPIAEPEKRVFNKRLPQSGKMVRFRPLMVSDEPAIIEMKRKYPKSMMSAQLHLQIMDVDGHKLNSPNDLKGWSAVDRDELRLEMDMHGGGVDLNIATTCPKCKKTTFGPMEIGAPFFIPSLAGF